MQVGAFLALRKLPTPIVPASISVRSAALRLTKLNHEAAIVMHTDGTRCGAVCRASLVAAVATHGKAAFERSVGDLALDRDMACCSIHDTLNKALARLSEEGRCFLGVTNRFSLVELIFRDELADRLLGCQSICAENRELGRLKLGPQRARLLCNLKATSCATDSSANIHGKSRD